MNVEKFLKAKINRQIQWNGQSFVFTRYKRNDYKELTDEVDREFCFSGVFHEGGGYGGMLNIEIFERDGGVSSSALKPMILCLYEDGFDLDRDDHVRIGDNLYKLVDKVDIKNLHIAYELSLELVR